VTQEMSYLDMQALVGITKHTGGFPATEELLAMCHIHDAKEVLEIGCGIGVGASHLARKYGLKVMATDISEEMLQWARQRVEREGVTGQVEFQRADVLELPFEADRFDAVISESVLAFLEDKDRAIREMTRVLKPGGWLGLNETCWLREPPAGLVTKADPSSALGTYILTADEWRAVWNAAALEETEVRVSAVDAAKEVRSRLSWVGARQILRAWSRIIPMYFTRPAMRSVVKETLGTPSEYYAFMGLALLTGRKPAHGN